MKWEKVKERECFQDKELKRYVKIELSVNANEFKRKNKGFHRETKMKCSEDFTFLLIWLERTWKKPAELNEKRRNDYLRLRLKEEKEKKADKPFVFLEKMEFLIVFAESHRASFSKWIESWWFYHHFHACRLNTNITSQYIAL